MNNLIEMLIQFNLTRQEAAIYLTLLSAGELTGYEVAKSTGISRSNAYTSLAALVEKGGAYLIEDAATRYSAVPAAEFCGNKIRALAAVKEELLKNIPQSREEPEAYLTIKGKTQILNKIRNMLTAATERVYLAAPEEVVAAVLPEIRACIAKGLKTVLITAEGFQVDGATVYTQNKAHYPIRVIADSVNVLTGDITEGNNATSLYSRKKNLVDLLKDSLKNEIQLIERGLS